MIIILKTPPVFCKASTLYLWESRTYSTIGVMSYRVMLYNQEKCNVRLERKKNDFRNSENYYCHLKNWLIYTFHYINHNFDCIFEEKWKYFWIQNITIALDEPLFYINIIMFGANHSPSFVSFHIALGDGLRPSISWWVSTNTINYKKLVSLSIFACWIDNSA